MGVLIAFVRTVDALNEAIGRIVAWFALAMIALCFAVVILRYGFSIGQIWMQELYVWLHASLFMLGAGYTLKHAGHVRVDAVYGRLSPRRRALIDIAGTLFFLLPWVVLMGWFGWQFAIDSFVIDESSSQPGGMAHVWVLKAAIPAFAVLLALQGLSLAARRVLGLAGVSGFELDEGRSAQGHG